MEDGHISVPVKTKPLTAMQIPFRSFAGFSLVEVMVAILLLVVGVLAALSMVSTAIKHNSIANRLSVETALRQQVMEELLSKKVDDPVVNTDTTTNKVFDLNGINTPGTNITIQGAGRFKAQYRITTNNPVSGVSRIDVFAALSTASNVPMLTCYKRVQ